ncbi:hypothetical protein BC332_28253 [Capsicum chinense]|nr:hypothetical protein BC332_28253 [Capsicum chinense]
MPQSKNLSFVGGDVLQSIPHADAILLKLVKHNWRDEDCVKILKRYRESSTYSDEGRKEKVLIIDMVLSRDEDEEDMTEVKLLFDVLMTGYMPSSTLIYLFGEPHLLHEVFMSCFTYGYSKPRMLDSIGVNGK